MDAERLKALTERTELATKCAKAIEDLQDADPRNTYMRLRMWNSNSGGDPLSESVLMDIFKRGKASMLADLEKQLEELLGIVPVKEHAEIIRGVDMTGKPFEN